MGPGSLAAVVADRAASTPRAAAVRVDRGDRLTFAGLEQRSNRLARAIVAAGVAPGDRVVLLCCDRHTPDLLAGYVAASKAGAVACVLPADAGRADLSRSLRLV